MCRKEFKFQSYLERHLKRKKPCKRIEDKEANFIHNYPQLSTIIYNNLHKNLQLSTQCKNVKNVPEKSKKIVNKIECTYCKSSFISVKSLNRHINHHCNFLPKNLKEKILEKRKKRENKKIELIKNSNTNVNVNNFNNFMNNSMVNSNNNITINLNAFGKENISSISKDKIVHILDRAYSSIPLALKMIHYDIKENRNIYQPNSNKPYVKYYDGERWLSQKIESMTDTISCSLSTILEDWFREHDKYLKENKKGVLEDMFNKFDDGKMEERVCHDFKLFLMNYSKDIKNHLDNK